MKQLLIIFILSLSMVSFSQEKDSHLNDGNEKFDQKKYAEAEVDYRISQAKRSKKSKATYNLGTTIYKQNQIAEAKSQFQRAAKEAKSKPEKHQAFHNFGNTLMKEKEYSGAVEAYKNALRNNPNDEETRYNYALAKKMLKENPPKDDKKDKNKDKNKDKKDDKKDKDKDQKDKDKKDDKKDKGDQGKNPQPKPNDVSKQKIENLLNAVNNEEKKVQDKVKAQKATAPVKNEKDW
jgi:tetratricopeptide (TPR) repeat protein